MKRGLSLLYMGLALMIPLFAVCAHAAIGDYDFSNPKDGDIDGLDLSQFIANYDPADLADFASYFGSTYTITTRRPNILLIVGDDIGFDVTTDMYPGLIDDLLGLYGPGGPSYDPDYQNIDPVNDGPASTPVLDSLASQGMRFSNAWVQPFCSPTRASIMTGLFTAKHNVTTYETYLSENHTTFVQKLKEDAGYGDGGYSTAAFGKWHIAGVPLNASNGMMPRQAGFDLYRGILGAAPNSYWNPNGYVKQDDSTGDEGTAPVTVVARELDGIGPTTYLPVVKVADTIDWINEKQTQNADKPWFAYLAMNLSHAKAGSPLMVVPDEDTLNCDENVQFCNEISSCSGDKFGSASECYNCTETCTGVQLMRAMTTSMDTVIGKLLEAVDSIPSDTYVIYIGDNGTPMYSFSPSLGLQIGNMYIHPENRGKGTAYESGARVAMAIKGPGIEAGQSSEFVHGVDLFSTILELAGLTPPVSVPDYTGASTPLDAVSLIPILFDGADTVRDPNGDYILTDANNIMPGSTGGKWAGARNGKYKVVCKDGIGTGNCEFYDLEIDPLEEHPLDQYETTSCGGWGTDDPQWHYCHLMDAIENQSTILW